MRNLIFILAILPSFLFAQEFQSSKDYYAKQQQENPTPEKRSGFEADRLVLGGNLGLMFGTVTSVDISPIAGYQFNKFLQAGIGLTYQYYKETYSTINGDYSYSFNTFGGNVYGRFSPIRQLFVHAELGALNYNINYYKNNTPADRQWVPYPLAGVGANLPLGDRAAFTLLVLWDLYEKDYSLYSNPIVRIGVAIGI